jgi:4-aminobutyrate aminotransferase-like enzyme
MWACDLVGLQPDMIVIGKAFGGGVPFGGVIARDSLVQEEVELAGWHFLTFMNQPLQAAAGLAVVGVVERENLVQRAVELGARSSAFLNDCVEKYPSVTEVHGPGMFLAVELRDGGDDLIAAQACREAYYRGIEDGVITYLGGKGNILKFKPALTISDDECDELLHLFEGILAYTDKRVAELGGRPGHHAI